ncbi:MAG: transcriptional regulator [Rhodospirillaceae bacterium]|nr:transcriptional regulator [Rhodospirillaceae bacterium]|tara:strand:- start:1185 stop:1820 length:636 start_codon:yes stop_codon:yes gene_type:complete
MPLAYIPKHFTFTKLKKQHDFIDKYNFGQLIVVKQDSLNITHLPFLLDRDCKPKGKLLSHVAVSNPIWKDLEAARVIAVFSGPHAYISPRWYETNDQVPTWNYSAIYVQGTARIIEPETLDELLTRLVEKEENQLVSRDKWSTQDISDSKYQMMRKSIVGIELNIEEIEAKLKMSQNRTTVDQLGVVAALKALGSDTAAAVASAIETKSID